MEEGAKKLEDVGYSAVNIAMMSASIVGPLASGAIIGMAGWTASTCTAAGLCVVASGVAWALLKSLRKGSR